MFIYISYQKIIKTKEFDMKIVASLFALSALTAPLMAEDKKPVGKVQEHKAVNFYLANNFSLTLTPGVRWQNNHFGLDLGAAFHSKGFGSASLAGLYYFNPYKSSGLQHYVSLGTRSNFKGALEVAPNEDMTITVPAALASISYGFQYQLANDSYWFMDFSLIGPFKVTSDFGTDTMRTITTPLPLMGIGYAF